MDETAITWALGDALVPEDGFAAVTWRYLPDPFPAWRDAVAAEWEGRMAAIAASRDGAGHRSHGGL